MGAAAIQQMADRAAQLLESRMGIRGKGLEAKLKRARRSMPRKVTQACEQLVAFAALSHNPKMLAQIDQTKVAEAYDEVTKYLLALPPKSGGVIGLAVGAAATAALGLLVLAVGYVLMKSKGLL